MNRIKSAAVNGALALFAVLAALALCEAAARVYLHYILDDTKFLKYASLRQVSQREMLQRSSLAKYHPHRYLGYYPAPNYSRAKNHHNGQGYRGDAFPREKPAGEIRIVCMGGSTTYTSHVDDPADAYPAVLERLLRADGRDVRVINAGAEGWSSYESLINLQFRLLELDPDILIIYHGVNDLIARMVWPPEAYLGDNSGAWGPLVSTRFMPHIIEHSTLARGIMIRLGVTQPHTSLPVYQDLYQPSFVGFRWRQSARGGGPGAGTVEGITARDTLEKNSPAFFQRNIEHLVPIAEHRGIEVMLASFAHSPEGTDEPLGGHEDFVWAYAESNDVLRDIAGRTHARFFDFAADFPVGPDYFTDGIHVNEAGAALKAEHFARFLDSEFLSAPQ